MSTNYEAKLFLNLDVKLQKIRKSLPQETLLGILIQCKTEETEGNCSNCYHMNRKVLFKWILFNNQSIIGHGPMRWYDATVHKTLSQFRAKLNQIELIYVL